MSKLSFSLFCFLICSSAVAVPKGHLLPLGAHRDSEGHIEEVSGQTTSFDFFTSFVNVSRPVVFRGALKNSAAVRLWDDAYLRNHYGSVSVKVDTAKRENRLLHSFQTPLSSFLDQYATSDWYLVDTLSPEMGSDVPLPECLKCGGYTHTIQDVVMWFSSGGTKSSFHFDTVENLNCQISGDKHWFFVDKQVGGLHEAIDHQESDFSGVDVDSVDMYQYPQFQDVPWWSAESHAGDCVYVPYKWFHYVQSVGRNLAVNIWWTPFDFFNDTDCKLNELATQTFLDSLIFTPGAQLRFFVIEMIKLNNNEITFEKANSLLVREHDGTKLLSWETFNLLDSDHNGLLTVGEVSHVGVDFFEKNIDCKPGEVNIHGKSEVDERDKDEKLDSHTKVHTEL